MSETKSICTPEVVGSITLKSENGVSVDMELTMAEPMADTDVIKLLLYPSEEQLPINCGTAEAVGDKICLTKSFSDNFNVDEAEIIRKNVFTEETFSLAKVCYAKEEALADDADMDEIRRKLELLQEHPAYKAYLSEEDSLKSPIEAAAEALDKLQEVLSRFNEEDDCKRYMDKIINTAKKYEFVNYMPSCFKWYRITDINAFSGITSMEHILYTADVADLFKMYGHYLLGLKENIACIAVPVRCGVANPIRHIDDCTVYIHSPEPDLEYCTVCISFEPDGQYFMPIC